MPLEPSRWPPWKFATSRGVLVGVALVLSVIGSRAVLLGQIQDRFDGGRPRWQLGPNDCGASIIQQSIDLQGGRLGSPAERITFAASEGTSAQFVYPIPPGAVIDDVRLQLWLRAAKTCGPVGLRIRFPKVADTKTGEPLATTVVAEAYKQTGTWQELIVSDVPRQMRIRAIALRGEFGSQIDLSDPYIDALVVNGYQGPGLNEFWLDDLELSGHVPQDVPAVVPIPIKNSPTQEAFAPGRIRSIVEYHGEPLEWLRQLGIDAVILDRPPTDSQLRSAAETGMKLISPPVPYVRTDWESKLGPIIAWKYPAPVDWTEIAKLQASATAARNLPEHWQRPFMMTVREGWREAATAGDIFIRELTTPYRNLSPTEVMDSVIQSQLAARRPLPWLISLDLSAPPELSGMLAATATRVGAPPVSAFEWHPPWIQTASALRASPRGFVFRSSTPLDSGSPIDQQRATVLRMLVRWLKAIEPIAGGAILGPEVHTNLPEYGAFSLMRPDAKLIVLTSHSGTSMNPRAGEGRVLTASLPTLMRDTVALRLSGPVPERLALNSNQGSTSLSIVSPDLVEIILLTETPEAVQPFLQQWQEQIRLSTTDRWQLVYEDLTTLRDTTQALPIVLPAATASLPMLAVAANTLTDAQIAIQDNDWLRASSLVRRADAFQLRTRSALIQQLIAADNTLTNAPTLQAPGGLHLHLTWPPATRGGHWQPLNLPRWETSDARQLKTSGWTHDRRLEEIAHVTVEMQGRNQEATVTHANGIRMAAWAKPGQALRGGYEGTTLRVRSPVIEGVDGMWVKIEAQVKTPLGFSGPEEGLLVYDNVGGSNLGQLVRGESSSQTITQFRLIPAQQKLQLFFELLGAGEALIENVTVSCWRLNARPLPLRPISISNP